jgi:hypothetical protein
MTGPAILRIFLAGGVLALLASCAEMPPAPTTTVAPAPTPPPGYWNGDGVPGSPKIIISISEQRAYFFKGKRLVGESTVSTGKPGFSTPPGYYTVVWKDKDHVSTVFGDYVDDFGNVVKSNIDSRKDSRPPGSHYDGARMPFAMFFRGGYAMHQGYVPPYAASHGCIRLPAGMAEPFFENAPLGTPVVVKQEPVVHTVSVPALVPAPATVPPAPNFVRPPAPASVRPATVRSTVPAPTPVPVRSPAAVLSRAPAPVRSPAPLPIAIRPPSPAPVSSPAPAAATRPAPTPSPIPTRKHRRVHSRARPHLPAPSPTPSPSR